MLLKLFQWSCCYIVTLQFLPFWIYCIVYDSIIDLICLRYHICVIALLWNTIMVDITTLLTSVIPCTKAQMTKQGNRFKITGEKNAWTNMEASFHKWYLRKRKKMHWDFSYWWKLLIKQICLFCFQFRHKDFASEWICISMCDIYHIICWGFIQAGIGQSWKQYKKKKHMAFMYNWLCGCYL